MQFSFKKQQGFTLIELITVIVILGVIATSITTFLRYGAQSYTDAADREELISTARFVIERLNREVRHALPNSARELNGSGKQCLEFTPIARSAIYVDIPVAPEAASNTVTLAPFASSLVTNSSQVSVYALNSDDIYNNANDVIASFDPSAAISPLLTVDDLDVADNNPPPTVVLTLNAATQFRADSPTKRLYFIETAVSYCLENGNLYRYQNYARSALDDTPIFDTNNRSLMAEHLENTTLPFSVVEATLQRNALVLVRLEFFLNLETIVFNNEIQVPNVP